MTLHDDELAIDVELVRQLVAGARPQWADLPVVPLEASGSSNALFRLGDDLLVRLPRQPGGSTTIEKESRWLPLIGRGLTVTVPEVVAVGQPGSGYPEKWSATRWIPGVMPRVPPPATVGGRPRRLATDLAQLVTELRDLSVPPAADDDPALSWYRGGRLADLDLDFRRSVDACRQIVDLGLDLDRALRTWDRAVDVEHTRPALRSWLHGDLLAENLLTDDGRLVAVLDFGGLAVGDPTVDLVVAWEVLDPIERRAFRAALDVDSATWATGAGWALLIAMITFPYYWHSMPARCTTRRWMVEAVLAEAEAL